MKSPKTTLNYLAFISIFSILFVSCGPSAEDFRKMDEAFKKEMKAKQDTALIVAKKYKAEADDYRRKLKELKSLLRETDTMSAGPLSPELKTDYDNNNMMTISYEALNDFSKAAYGDIFEFHSRGEAIDALSNFQKIDEGKIEDVYSFSEKTAASLSTKVTPYVLVLKRISIADVKIEGDKGYSGGETSGYAWLVDLRDMKIIGSLGFEAVPGSLRMKKSEGSYSLQSKAKSSSNAEVSRIISEWLRKFKQSGSV